MAVHPPAPAAWQQPDARPVKSPAPRRGLYLAVALLAIVLAGVLGVFGWDLYSRTRNQGPARSPGAATRPENERFSDVNRQAKPTDNSVISPRRVEQIRLWGIRKAREFDAPPVILAADDDDNFIVLPGSQLAEQAGKICLPDGSLVVWAGSSPIRLGKGDALETGEAGMISGGRVKQIARSQPDEEKGTFLFSGENRNVPFSPDRDEQIRIWGLRQARQLNALPCFMTLGSDGQPKGLRGRQGDELIIWLDEQPAVYEGIAMAQGDAVFIRDGRRTTTQPFDPPVGGGGPPVAASASGEPTPYEPGKGVARISAWAKRLAEQAGMPVALIFANREGDIVPAEPPPPGAGGPWSLLVNVGERVISQLGGVKLDLGKGDAALIVPKAILKVAGFRQPGPIRCPRPKLVVLPALPRWPCDKDDVVKEQDETATALDIPKELTLDLGKNVKMKLVLVPTGTFRMGCSMTETKAALTELGGQAPGNVADDPEHEARIVRPFYIGKFEVTQEQYEAVTGQNPSKFSGLQNPVDSVSWDDAVKFCEALSKRVGKHCELPTEAEWEYACRAGANTPFNLGAKITANQANYNGQGEPYRGTEVVNRQTTIPVGSLIANAFGLYDMHGNVVEWCADRFPIQHGPAAGADNKPAFAAAARGGSWNLRSPLCRSATRVLAMTNAADSSTGFRIVVDIGEETISK